MISYRLAKKVLDLRESGTTYDRIRKETKLAKGTISKILKLGEKGIEKIRKNEKAKEAVFKGKAEKLLLREMQDLVAEESLERLRELLNNGLLVEELYEKKREQAFLNAIQKARNEEIKNYVTRLFVILYLKGYIDKTELARKILAIKYA